MAQVPGCNVSQSPGQDAERGTAITHTTGVSISGSPPLHIHTPSVVASVPPLHNSKVPDGTIICMYLESALAGADEGG